MESQEAHTHHHGHQHHYHVKPVRVHVKRSHKYKFNGKASYLYALRKYQFNPPSGGNVFIDDNKRLLVRGRGHARNEVGELPTSDIQNDSMYLCPVTIGQGPTAVTVNLDFDTGSADLWVFSSELPKSVPTTGHIIYNPTKSPTAKKLGNATWKIAYGDGSSASGNVYTDTVTLGGLVIQNQAVECAEKLSSAFSSGEGDGLLGLAFDKINTVTPGPAPTPVQNMNTEGVTPKGTEVFTCKLTRHNEAPGFYTFGYIDSTQLGGATPFYAPIIDTSGFWKVNSMSAVVGGQVIQRTGNTGICDTGTTLCLVDTALVQAVYAQIPGAKFDSESEGWIFPSSVSESKLPVVEIGLGDPNSTGGEHRFTIYPGDLAFSAASPGWVYGGIQDRGDQDFDILGDIFLKNVYAIWYVKGQQFGAVQRQPGPFVSS